MLKIDKARIDETKTALVTNADNNKLDDDETFVAIIDYAIDVFGNHQFKDHFQIDTRTVNYWLEKLRLPVKLVRRAYIAEINMLLTQPKDPD